MHPLTGILSLVLYHIDGGFDYEVTRLNLMTAHSDDIWHIIRPRVFVHFHHYFEELLSNALKPLDIDLCEELLSLHMLACGAS